MDPLALTLVLASATLHASWNLLAKRARGGFVVAWAFASVGAVALAPVGAWAVLRAGGVDAATWGWVGASACLHIGYFVSLQRAYGLGDLSLVYPLARGSGPALATILAIVVLAERPGPWALAGVALVTGAAFGLAGGGAPGSARVVRAGLTTGAFIAAYSVWDASAVARAGIDPLAFAWLSEVVRAALLTPVALARRAELRRVVRDVPSAVVGVGFLSPAAYLLVLIAFTRAPVSQVAPLREISMVIAVLLGSGLLREGNVRRRLTAAAAMVVGAALLASSPMG